MISTIAIRKCETLRDFNLCVELQRQVWGESDLEVEPATLFIVAAHTGGQVLGAFDGPRLAGFTLAVAGLRDATPYLHSHMTGVHPDYQGRGVGKSLKLFQREDALARGVRRIEWTFDPLGMRNAHFNLNLLGAIARKYLPNLYGVTSSPLHRNMETDRLLAEWHLDSPRVIAAIQNVVPAQAPAAAILMPEQLETWQAQGSPELVTLQARVRKEFTDYFSRGYAALAATRSARESAYSLAPWSDF